MLGQYVECLETVGGGRIYSLLEEMGVSLPFGLESGKSMKIKHKNAFQSNHPTPVKEAEATSKFVLYMNSEIPQGHKQE